MAHYQQPYYVGLLSAAAIHGAAHQQPQTFQVITNKPLRPIKVRSSSINFFTKQHIIPESYQSTKTPSGYMQVSIPETTALDLIRYIKSVGYLHHATTVLVELQEKFDKERFIHILDVEAPEITCVQRLGYLLEMIGASQEIIFLLKQWINEKNPQYIPLRSDKIYQKSEKNVDWHLYINEVIEADI